MPYYLGRLHQFEQSIQVILPENWNVAVDEKTIEGEAFTYVNRISGSGNKVFVNHFYQTKSESISGDQVPEFLRKHDKIQSELSFFLTHNENLAGSSTGLSWLSIVIASIAVIASLYFAYRTNTGYDPEPWKYAEDKAIGGWLILPAIGFVITPIRLVLFIVDQSFFDVSTWQNLSSFESNKVTLQAIFATEIFYNFMLLVFACFFAIMFFMRRTSVPKLLIVYYVVAFTFPILDHIAIELTAPGFLSPADTKTTIADAVRVAVVAAIWIPYFHISERSKSTFCKRLNPDHYYLDRKEKGLYSTKG